MSPVTKVCPLLPLFLLFLLVSIVSSSSIATSNSMRESFNEYRRISASFVSVMWSAKAPAEGGNYSSPAESLASDNEFTRKVEEALKSSGVEIVEYWQVASNVLLDSLIMGRIGEVSKNPEGGEVSPEAPPAIFILGLDFERLPSILKPKIVAGRLPATEGECAIPEVIHRAMEEVESHGRVLKIKVPIFLREPPYVKNVDYSCEVVGVIKWSPLQLQLLDAGFGMGPIVLDGRYRPQEFKDSLQFRFIAMVSPDRSEEIIRRANEHPFIRENNLHVYPLTFFTQKETSAIEEDLKWKSTSLLLIGILSALLVAPLATYLLLRDKVKQFSLMTQMGIPWRSIGVRVVLLTSTISLLGASIGLPSGTVLSEVLTNQPTKRLGISVRPVVSELGFALIVLEVIVTAALTYALLEIAGRSHPAKHV